MRIVVVVAGYLILTLWYLWPLPLVAASHAGYSQAGPLAELQAADWRLIAWGLAWGAHALVEAPLRLFHANAFHPAPYGLAYSEHFLGHQVLAAPVFWATGNAVLTANVTLIANVVLSGVGMWALARRFASEPAAFVAGALFAFTPWRRANLFHMHVIGIQYLPLAVLFGERWLDRAAWRDAAALAVVLTLQALTSIYLAYATAFLWAAYLPLALWRWRRRLDRRRIVGLLVACGTAGAIVIALSLPYLHLRALGLLPDYGGGEYEASLGSLFGGIVARRWLTSDGIGVVGWAFALLALLPPWRQRVWPLVIGVALLVTGVAVTSGRAIVVDGWRLPGLAPWLTSIVPGFATVRVPQRFIVVAHAGLCLLAALGITRCLGFVRGWAAGVAAAGALVLALYGVGFGALAPLPIHREPTCGTLAPADAYLAQHGGGRPLMELPIAGPAAAAERMLVSTCHWLPIVGGHTAYDPPADRLLYSIADGLPGAGALQRLVDTADIGWILVHRDALGRRQRARWQAPLPAGLEVAGRFGEDLLLRVTRLPGPASRRDRLFSTRETLGGVPLAPLGEACPGRIRLDERRGIVSSERDVVVPIVIHNDGDAPWPAYGMIPRHLVRVRACVEIGRGVRCMEPRDLAADVPARGRVAVDIRLQRSPLRSGAVVIELLQMGDGPLARCGVAPLRVPLDDTPRPRRES